VRASEHPFSRPDILLQRGAHGTESIPNSSQIFSTPLCFSCPKSIIYSEISVTGLNSMRSADWNIYPSSLRKFHSTQQVGEPCVGGRCVCDGQNDLATCWTAGTIATPTTGRMAVTRVPGLFDWICRVPPNCRKRSRIPRSPTPA
jgi:hypothetical protein